MWPIPRLSFVSRRHALARGSLGKISDDVPAHQTEAGVMCSR